MANDIESTIGVGIRVVEGKVVVDKSVAKAVDEALGVMISGIKDPVVEPAFKVIPKVNIDAKTLSDVQSKLEGMAKGFQDAWNKVSSNGLVNESGAKLDGNKKAVLKQLAAQKALYEDLHTAVSTLNASADKAVHSATKKSLQTLMDTGVMPKTQKGRDNLQAYMDQIRGTVGVLESVASKAKKARSVIFETPAEDDGRTFKSRETAAALLNKELTTVSRTLGTIIKQYDKLSSPEAQKRIVAKVEKQQHGLAQNRLTGDRVNAEQMVKIEQGTVVKKAKEAAAQNNRVPFDQGLVQARKENAKEVEFRQRALMGDQAYAAMNADHGAALRFNRVFDYQRAKPSASVYAEAYKQQEKLAAEAIKSAQAQAATAMKAARESVRLENVRLGQQAYDHAGGNVRGLHRADQEPVRVFLQQRQADIVQQQSNLIAQRGQVGANSREYRSLNHELVQVRNHLGTVNAAISGHVGFLNQAALATRQFLRYAVLYGAGFKAMGAVTSDVAQAFDLDKSLQSIKAITQASSESMSTIEAGIKGVASASEFGIKNIAEAATVLAQAGVEVKNLPGILSTVEKLASTTASDLKSTADVVSSLAEIYQQANSGEGTRLLADQVAQAINISKLNIEGLKTIISLGSSTAKANNIDNPEFLGAAATLSNKGIKDSTIATGLRQATLEIFSPDDKTIKFLKSRYSAVGEQVSEADIQARFRAFKNAENPYIAAAREMRRIGVAGQGKEEFSRVFDVRAENVWLPLIESLDKLSANTARISEGGAVAKGAATQMEAFNNALTSLGSTLVSLTHDTLGGLIPELSGAATTLKNRIEDLRTWNLENRAEGGEPGKASNLLGLVTGAIAGWFTPAGPVGKLAVGAAVGSKVNQLAGRAGKALGLGYDPQDALAASNQLAAEARAKADEVSASFAAFDPATKGGQAAQIAESAKAQKLLLEKLTALLGRAPSGNEFNGVLQLGTTGAEKNSPARARAIEDLKKAFGDDITGVIEGQVDDLVKLGGELNDVRSALMAKVSQNAAEMAQLLDKPAGELSDVERESLAAWKRLTDSERNLLRLVNPDMTADEVNKVSAAFAKWYKEIKTGGEKAKEETLKGIQKFKELITTGQIKNITADSAEVQAVMASMVVAANDGQVEILKELEAALKANLKKLGAKIRKDSGASANPRVDNSQEQAQFGFQNGMVSDLGKYIGVAEQNQQAKGEAAAAVKALEKDTADEAKRKEDITAAYTNPIADKEKELARAKADLESKTPGLDQQVGTAQANHELAKTVQALEESKNTLTNAANKAAADLALLNLQKELELKKRDKYALPAADEVDVELRKLADDLRTAQAAYDAGTRSQAVSRTSAQRSDDILNFQQDIKANTDELTAWRKDFNGARANNTLGARADELIAKRQAIGDRGVELSSGLGVLDGSLKGDNALAEHITSARAALDEEIGTIKAEISKYLTRISKVVAEENLKALTKEADLLVQRGDIEGLAAIQEKRKKTQQDLLDIEKETYLKEVSIEETDSHIKALKEANLAKAVQEQVAASEHRSSRLLKDYQDQVKAIPENRLAGYREATGRQLTIAQQAGVDAQTMAAAMTHGASERQHLAEAQAAFNKLGAEGKNQAEAKQRVEAIQENLDAISAEIIATAGRLESAKATFVSELKSVSNQGILSEFEQLNSGFSGYRKRVEANMAGALNSFTDVLAGFITQGFDAAGKMQELYGAMQNTAQAETQYQDVIASRVGLLNAIQEASPILKESQAVQTLIIQQATTAQQAAEASAKQQALIAKAEEDKLVRENSLMGKIGAFTTDTTKGFVADFAKSAMGEGIRGILGMGTKGADNAEVKNGRLQVDAAITDGLDGLTSALGGGGQSRDATGVLGGVSGIFDKVTGLFGKGAGAAQAASSSFQGNGMLLSYGNSSLTGANGGATAVNALANQGADFYGSAGAGSGAATGAGASAGAAMAGIGALISIATSAMSIYSTVSNYNKSKKARDEILAAARAPSPKPLQTDQTNASATNITSDTHYKDLAGYTALDDRARKQITETSNAAVAAMLNHPSLSASVRSPSAAKSVESGADKLAGTVRDVGAPVVNVHPQPIRVVTTPSPDVMTDHMASAAGEKVISSYIYRNARTIKQTIG